MTHWTPEENRDRRTPAAFLPYQQRWVADEAQVKVVEKSRRIGLSWCEAGEDALLSASAGGMDVFYIGYNQDMAREFVEDCADWSKHYNQAAGEIEAFLWADEAAEDKHISAFRIRYPSGWKIVALSSKPSNLRGKQGKIVIDEAAFHDDLAGLLKAAIAMLMWGGRVVIISTHNGDDHPFNELVNAIRAEKLPYALHRITIDDAIEEGLYKRICLRLGKQWSKTAEEDWREELFDFYGDDADEELLCIPSHGSGTYLTRLMIEGVMDEDVPVIRWVPPAKDFVHWSDAQRVAEMERWLADELGPMMDARVLPTRQSWFGEDFGRTSDLTVIWPLQELPGLTYSTPFVLELRDCPFQQQEQALFFLGDGLPRLSGGALDKGGNGAFLAERAMQRWGADRIEEIALNQGWYLANMPPMKATFEDRTTTMPKDADLLDDFRAIKKIAGIPRVPTDQRTLSKYGGRRHGDAAVAYCLAVYAARTKAGGPVAYESVTKRRMGGRGAW